MHSNTHITVVMSSGIMHKGPGPCILKTPRSPGDSEGQGSLVYCSPWTREELDTTEQLTSNNLDDSEPWPELKLLGHSLCSLSPETVISETPAQDLIRS